MLHVVNNRVVVEQHSLRLVIEDDPADSARRIPDDDPGRRLGTSPGIHVERLTAARVRANPVPEWSNPAAPPRARTPAGEVRREMMQASGLSPDDARAILARRTAEFLEGGRAARLAPERRAGLERLGTKMGLRAFDTSLVIAITQDAARTGAAVTSNAVEGRLKLVGNAGASHEPEAGRVILTAFAVAAALAVLLTCIMVKWVGGV